MRFHEVDQHLMNLPNPHSFKPKPLRLKQHMKTHMVAMEAATEHIIKNLTTNIILSARLRQKLIHSTTASCATSQHNKAKHVVKKSCTSQKSTKARGDRKPGFVLFKSIVACESLVGHFQVSRNIAMSRSRTVNG